MLNFDPKASGFSVANALACAEASSLAYRDAGEIEGALGYAGFSKIEHLESDVCHAFWSAQADYQVLAFKGTDPKCYRDIRTDLEVEMVEIGPAVGGVGPARVHSGFYESVMSIKADLFRVVDPRKPLFITGHSKGGGEAVICANILSRPVHSIYTFGQPRVGNKWFAAALQAAFKGGYFRVRCRADIIPHLPHFSASVVHDADDQPDGMALNFYRHFGDDVLISVGGWLDFDPPLWQRVLNDVAAIELEWRTSKHLAPIADHSMDGDYLPGLARAVNSRINLNTWGQKR